MDSSMLKCTASLYRFGGVTDTELIKIIYSISKTNCSSDTFPTRLLMYYLLAIIRILQHIVNRYLTITDVQFLVNLLSRVHGSRSSLTYFATN